MSKLEKAFKKIVKDALKATLNYGRHEWITDAQANLKSTREPYIAGLQGITMLSETSGYVELKGNFPQMVEEGYTAFDMKAGFESSPKVKKGKNGGWYLTIPYRHATKSTTMPTMPPDIFKQAKGLGNGEKLTSALVESLGYKRETSWAGYTWTNTQYDNLTRIVKTYESGAKRGQYMTFRRVSDRTDPKAWQHPGYKGLKALDRVAPKTEEFFYEYMRG